MFRPLKASEVDVFPKMVKEKGCLVLLYKDARCDMNILDETVGNFYWKREHSRDNANCTVSIYSKELKQWVSKEDTGVESNQDKTKGLASDSFKRACFNWGIGRELYTSPFIWIKLEPSEINKKGDKVYLKSNIKFHVYHLKVENGVIIELGIKDQNNKERFKYKAVK